MYSWLLLLVWGIGCNVIVKMWFLLLCLIILGELVVFRLWIFDCCECFFDVVEGLVFV